MPVKTADSIILRSWRLTMLAWMGWDILQWSHVSVAISQITGKSTVVLQFVQFNNSENNKAMHYWLFSYGSLLMSVGFPSKTANNVERRFHFLTSSCYSDMEHSSHLDQEGYLLCGVHVTLPDGSMSQKPHRETSQNPKAIFFHRYGNDRLQLVFEPDGTWDVTDRNQSGCIAFNSLRLVTPYGVMEHEKSV